MISPLERRVLELSRKHRLGHLSSNLTAVGIIDAIYREKRPQDLFVLSQGHAGLALYVALEKHEGRDAEALYLKHRTHPHRAPEDGIHVSAGSLGCGITVALGLAMADRGRDVHCLISDGEAAEGSCGESLQLKGHLGLTNLHVWVNLNGYSCLGAVDTIRRVAALQGADPTVLPVYTDGVYMRFPFLKGVQGHYHNLTDADWAWVEAQP